MNKRHKLNRNLKITYRNKFNGLRLINNDDGVVINYLTKMHDTIDKALDDHPRTMAVRVDLRLGKNLIGSNSLIISDFIASLSAQVQADLNRKKRDSKRVHNCTVRYVWVKERDSALNRHYHMVLLFNKDTYAFLGKYGKEANLSHMIEKAWARALDLDIDEASRLAHFPRNPIYYLNKNSDCFMEDFENLFHRISYFAKVRTKEYGSRHKNFGSSRR